MEAHPATDPADVGRDFSADVVIFLKSNSFGSSPLAI
jgi:hypothetical protein